MIAPLSITAAQLVAHATGDYVIQSDWMAGEKTKSWRPAAAHALSYALPFLFLTRSPFALLFIVWTHFVIDHYRLARYVCWAKNHLGPLRTYMGPHGEERRRYAPWSECAGTGYDASKPPWLAVWLLIICDNVMHVLCNAVALTYL